MVWYGNFTFLLVLLLAVVSTVYVEGGPQTDKKRVPARHGQVGGPKECHYTKSAWSECNSKSNTRTRTLTLKKTDDESKCEKTKVIEKKCKRVCKYDKGAWSKCNAQNEMTRVDNLKNAAESDASCEKTKVLTKKCKSKVIRAGKGQKRNNKHQKQHQQNEDEHQQSQQQQDQETE